MNPFRKPPLLIGGALLFAGCGRLAPNDGSRASDAGTGNDAGTTQDAGDHDTGAIVDAGVTDRGPLLDSGPPPPRDTGVTPRDTGIQPDTGPPEQAPTNGQACDTRGDAYCGRGLALFWCTGTHWQETSSYNCVPGSCVTASPRTAYGTATCNTPDANSHCGHREQAWCDENLQPLMVCWNAWYAVNNGMCDTCELDDHGYITTMCATPGFVGIAKAGRQRAPGQVLRRI